MMMAALAQEPDDGFDATDDEEIYEVRVYGDDAIREAHDRVVWRMKDLGWRMVRDRHGKTVFRAPRGWMGRAILHHEGFMTFTSPRILLQDMNLEALDAYRGPTAQKLLAEATLSRGFEQLERDPFPKQSNFPAITTATGASRSKRRGVQGVVLEGVAPAVAAYRDAIQETAFQAQFEVLPDRLDALWRTGEPLSGGPTLEDLEQRRRAVLHHWATRADTPQGIDACRAIELWLEREVMASEHPVTLEEQAFANEIAQTHHGRRLALHVR